MRSRPASGSGNMLARRTSKGSESSTTNSAGWPPEGSQAFVVGAAGVKTCSDSPHASAVEQRRANRRRLSRRMSPPLRSRDQGGTPASAREPAAMRPLLHSTASAVTSRPTRSFRIPRESSREASGITSLCPSVVRLFVVRSALLHGTWPQHAWSRGLPRALHPLPSAPVLGSQVEPAAPVSPRSRGAASPHRFALSPESSGGRARLLEPREPFDDVHRSCGRGAAPRG